MHLLSAFSSSYPSNLGLLVYKYMPTIIAVFIKTKEPKTKLNFFNFLFIIILNDFYYYP